MLARMKLLHALFVVLTISLMAGCTHVTRETIPPKVKLIGVVLQEVQLFEQRYQLTLRLQNPNEYSIKVRGIEFNVDLNGEPFAQGVANDTVTLPGFGETTAEVAVSSNILTLMRQLSENKNDISYSIHGKIKLDNIPLPISFSSEGSLEDFGGKKNITTNQM